MQIRLLNFGDSLTQQNFLLYTQSLDPVGVYYGLDMVVVSTTTFSLSPGAVLMPDGIIVVENSNVPFPPIVPLPVVPTILTVLVQHDDAAIIGGQPAFYSVVTGLVPPAADQVVIGYIKHPGGGAALSVNMWVPTIKHRSDLQIGLSQAYLPTNITPPYKSVQTLGPNTTHGTVVVTGSGVVADTFVGNGVILPPGDTSLAYIQVVAGSSPPQKVSITANMPINNSVQIDLIDHTGTVVTVGLFNGIAALTTYTGIVGAGGSFISGSYYLVRLTIIVQALTTSQLGPIIVDNNPLS